MATVLITGASGFIGSALSAALADTHDVVRLSRTERPGLDQSHIGSFAVQKDLDRLADVPVDVVVHLAAVDSSLPDDEVLRVNVLGTHLLLQQMVARRCRKFVLAGSIAAIGCLSPMFRPLTLPIADDHPCLATDAYGLSKAMVEDLARYFARSTPDADFINLRIGVVLPDGRKPSPNDSAASAIPFCEHAGVRLADVVEAIRRCVDAPRRPGVRIMNLVGPNISSALSTRDTLAKAGVADEVDTAWLPTKAHAPLYTMDKIAAEVGFIPRHSTRGDGDER